MLKKAFLLTIAFWMSTLLYPVTGLKKGIFGLPKKHYIPVPIVFHSKYDIGLLGIERFSPFDTKKYGKIAAHLQKAFENSLAFQTPNKITDEQLLMVHTADYLKSLENSTTIACGVGMLGLSMVPNFILQRALLNPMRYATGGTVLGAQLAMKYGWAINLSGGYHHAKADKGDGFCFFADIPLAIKILRLEHPSLKVLVVDLDAHQGNGVESLAYGDSQTFIFDIYNADGYPGGDCADRIDFRYPLHSGASDATYLTILKTELPKAIALIQPDLIIYNAGTDIYESDQLGGLHVSRKGIIERDHVVFEQAFINHIPILMVLSGGYSKESAEIIGASLEQILRPLVNHWPMERP